MIHQDLVAGTKTIARNIPKDERYRRITSRSEKDLYEPIAQLIRSMMPEAHVEITHGPEEKGKDLVVIFNDKFRERNIGVIVKRGKDGKITGQTSGVVDEIISQCRQAFAHQSRLKMVAKPVSIDEIWIVVAASLSRGAQERIEHELRESGIRSYLIIDVSKLDEWFTEYFPEFYLDKEFFSFIAEKMKELTKGEMRNYEEEYIEPLVALVETPDTQDDSDLLVLIEKKRLKLGFAKEQLQSNKRVVLIGDPGVGKTTTLRKIALELLGEAAKKAETDGIYEVPILMRAADVLMHEKAYQILKEYFPGDFSHLLESRKISINYLLIDGLDEVPFEERGEALQKLQHLAEELGASLLIASRKINILKSIPEDYKKMELLPFEVKQAIDFFRKRISDETLLEHIKSALTKIRHQLNLTPLSLKLLIGLVQDYNEIPASVVELYDRYTDAICGKYDSQKGIRTVFEYTLKKRLLATLAYTLFYEGSTLSVEAERFHAFLKEYSEEYGIQPEKINELLSELNRTGLLVSDSPNKISFSHRSFLDYFIALYIWNHRGDFKDLYNFLKGLYFSDLWNDVVLFYAGLEKELNEDLLTLLLEHSDEGGNPLFLAADKLLIGRLLQAAWHTPTTAKSKAVTRALTFAPEIRTKLRDLFNKGVPLIFADWLTMTLSEYSFGSATLKPTLDKVFNDLLANPTQESVFEATAILWAIKNLEAKSEYSRKIDKLLEAASHATLDAIEETTLLVILSALEDPTTKIGKSIRRAIKRKRAKHPEIMRFLGRGR